jgi:hypothetical protein
MNIFLVDQDVDNIASALDDSRLFAQYKELLQLIGAVSGHQGLPIPKPDNMGTYSTYWIRNPLAVWLLGNIEYQRWAVSLAVACFNEHVRRFNKVPFDVPSVLTINYVDKLYGDPRNVPFPDKQCLILPRDLRMQEGRNISDIRTAIVSYRYYYKTVKVRHDDNIKWTNAEPPAWLDDDKAGLLVSV